MVPTGTLGVVLVGCTEEEIQKQENAGGSQVQCAPLDLPDRQTSSSLFIHTIKTCSYLHVLHVMPNFLTIDVLLYQ